MFQKLNKNERFSKNDFGTMASPLCTAYAAYPIFAPLCVNAPFLLQGFLECIRDNSLTSTMTQGLIVLIPKPGKDTKQINNLLPITLLYSDYKLLILIFANRLKIGLAQIISKSPSSFMKGKSKHNNIRLVLDITDYHEWIADDGYILFLDFKKVFDVIEYAFIL